MQGHIPGAHVFEADFNNVAVFKPKLRLPAHAYTLRSDRRKGSGGHGVSATSGFSSMEADG